MLRRGRAQWQQRHVSPRLRPVVGGAANDVLDRFAAAVAEPGYAILAVSALGGALRELGRDADVAAGVEACLDVIAAAA